MARGIALKLSGEFREDTGKALVQRLIELGKGAEMFDDALVSRIGPAAGLVCRLLVRNGIFVVIVAEQMEPDCECKRITLDSNDTPDFAAEKILDMLAHENLVSIESHDYSPDEEEEIRRRLADIGYIE